MASPLNTFITVATNVTTTLTKIYEAPAETTSIVLLAQATNVDPTYTASITFIINISGADYELVSNFPIPNNDAAALLSGKLVIQSGSSVWCNADVPDRLKITLSILETT